MSLSPWGYPASSSQKADPLRASVGVAPTPVLSQYFWTGLGMTGAQTLTFLAIAVMGRTLGLEEFGRFSLAFYIMVTLAQLSWAVDDAMIRHIGAHPEQERGLLAAALLLKIGFHVVIIAAGLALARPVLVLLLHKENFSLLYALALAGAGASALYQVVLAYCRALQQFRRYVVWSVGYGAVFLGGVVVLNWLGPRTATVNLFWFVCLSFFAAVVWWLTLPRASAVLDLRTEFTRLVKFGAWLLVASLAGAVQQRADLFVLSRNAAFGDLGLYGAAVRVATIVEMFTRVITVVLFPKAMAVRDAGGARQLLRESAAVTGWAAAAGLVTVAVAGLVIQWFFGAGFADATQPARLLCAANLVLVVYTPLTFVFYMCNKPQFMAALRLVELAGAVLLALLLVPKWGVNGAATARLLTNCGALLFTVVCAKRLIGTLPLKR